VFRFAFQLLLPSKGKSKVLLHCVFPVSVHDLTEPFLLAWTQDKEARGMVQASREEAADLEQLRQQLTTFRNTQSVRSRLPEPLWASATELASRYGVHRIARALHLDYTGLKKRVEQQARPTPKPASVTPTFVEVVGPAVPVTPCRVEVESSHGKLRFELPAMATTELVSLLRAFLSQ
jgi:hypothetical protein